MRFLVPKPCAWPSGPFSVPKGSSSLFPFSFLLTGHNTQPAPGLVAGWKRAKGLHDFRQQEHKTKTSVPLLQATARQRAEFCSVLVWGCLDFFAPGGSAFALNSFTSSWGNHTHCLDNSLLRPSNSTPLDSCYLNVSRGIAVQRCRSWSTFQFSLKEEPVGQLAVWTEHTTLNRLKPFDVDY